MLRVQVCKRYVPGIYRSTSYSTHCNRQVWQQRSRSRITISSWRPLCKIRTNPPSLWTINAEWMVDWMFNEASDQGINMISRRVISKTKELVQMMIFMGITRWRSLGLGGLWILVFQEHHAETELCHARGDVVSHYQRQSERTGGTIIVRGWIVYILSVIWCFLDIQRRRCRRTKTLLYHGEL